MGNKLIKIIVLAWFVLAASQLWAFTPSGLLEIHYINVGWGTSVLVIGPDGTRILMDGGRDNMGVSRVIPYMQSMNLMPPDGLTYILASHLHSDHIAGLTEVMNRGYDVTGAVYYNGSNYSNSYVTAFMSAAVGTSSGPARAITLGTVIQLGDSAIATCVCVNGYVIGHGYVPGSHEDENDRSVGMLIKYAGFEYLFAGDLGGGEGDYNCTHRSTAQANVETNLARAIMPNGVHPLLTADGVEAIHVNHHGSESSTNSDYMNLLTPAVACISTGSGQSPDYMFPRYDVVDNVLLGGGNCITAPDAIVLQNEEGYPAGSLTSYSGYCLGNFVITTSGVANYTINADGQVTEGPDERVALGVPLTIPFDGVPPDTIPPIVTVVSPDGGEQWAAESWHIITWNAFDTVGVAYYAIDYSSNAGSSWTSVQAQTGGNPEVFGWSLPQIPSDNYLIRVTAWDAAGNHAGDSSNGTFSIITSQDTIPPSVTLTSPNGGELWYSGEIDTIQWLAGDNIGIASYSVFYTSNNGTNWNSIQARTPGNPQFLPWLVPNITSNNCRIKVIVWDDLQNQAADTSDAAFRITYRDNQGPTVDIIIPDGGEIWTVGSNRYIFWSANDTSGVDSVSLQYSIDAGASWRVIFPYTHDNPGYYSWNLPDARTRQALVRAACKDSYGNVGYGSSQAVFTIRKSPVKDRSVPLSPLAR